MTEHPRRILLAEDDPHDLALTLDVLRLHGLADETVTVADGVEVLDYLLRRGAFASVPAGQPAVVLLDLKMPRLGGLDVLAEIRRTASLRMLPVVMLSSSREEADISRSYGLGANAYIVKPVDFDDFVEAIRVTGQFWTQINVPPPGTAPP
ncbi:MAG: response regulator [Burkholderiales bacterium]